MNGNCNGKTLDASMMTSFSARKAKDNARISRSNPDEKVNHVEELEATPDFYTEHRMMKKGMANEISTGGERFRITDYAIDSTTHNINPYYEINGVGLLYFAAYPIIADE